MLDERSDDTGHPDLEATLREVERLQNDRSHRDARGAFFIEGVRNVVQAIENGFTLRTLIASDRLLIVPIARKLVRDQRRSGIPTFQVSPETFRRVSRTEHASGVGAIVAQRWSRQHGISPRAGLCWVVLEDVRSPGNLGSLIRTSEAIGGAGFIITGNRIDPYDPMIVRASMGAVFRQAFVRTDYRSLRHWLRRHGCRPIGASPDGSVDLHGSVIPAPRSSYWERSAAGSIPTSARFARHLYAFPWSAQRIP